MKRIKVRGTYNRFCPVCKGENKLDDDIILIVTFFCGEVDDIGLNESLSEYQCPHGHKWRELSRVVEIWVQRS